MIVVCAGPPSAYTVALANPHRARPKVHGTASSMSVVHICVLTGAVVLVSPMRSVGPSWAHRAATSSKVNLVPGAATRHHNLMWKGESRPVRRGSGLRFVRFPQPRVTATDHLTPRAGDDSFCSDWTISSSREIYQYIRGT